MVLFGPGDIDAQFGGSVKRKIRVAEELAGEKDKVSLSIADNVVGLLGGRDKTNRTGGDARCATDLFGEWNLITRGGRDLGVGHQAAGRTVDQQLAN